VVGHPALGRSRPWTSWRGLHLRSRKAGSRDVPVAKPEAEFLYWTARVRASTALQARIPTGACFHFREIQ
jgi:hypothetical protein